MMETACIVLCCLIAAIAGAWEVSKHKQPPGRLPEDIQ
jgi:hypothetical protein